jgi:8-oxo-dGTP pyrophosphatase MutT (NUDIX family)
MLERLVDQLGQQQPRRTLEPDRPQAAVALLLVPDPDRLLLIRRAEREGDPWSGHLALPGGRFDAGDVDLLATAIRETEEETGVRLEREWCRAELDDLVPRTPTLPPIMVRPFVFLLREAIAPGVSNEVVHAAWLPLADLVAEGVRGPRTVLIRGESRVVDGYHLPEGFLWGMTERILTPVLTAWQALA